MSVEMQINYANRVLSNAYRKIAEKIGTPKYLSIDEQSDRTTIKFLGQ